MSLSNTTTKVKYTGDGANTSFAITFDIILSDTEVRVILRDETDPLDPTETLQVEGVNYNLTGAVPPAFSTTVEMVIAPSATQELLIYRELPLTQLLDYIETSEFRAESQEDGLDKLTAIVQELGEQLTRAALLSRATDANLPVVFAEPKADNLIGWDAEGDDLRNFTAAEILSLAIGQVLFAVNNLSDVDDAATSATNLGLGAANDVTHNSMTLVANLSAARVLSLADVKFETELNTVGISTPSNPAAGRFKLYMKSDGNLYRLNDAGSEVVVGGSTFFDNVFRIQDDGDNSKQIAFEASAITTATTRTVTMPDEDVDLTVSSDAAGSFANRTLSNLGVTALNADLLPGAPNVRSLGAAANELASVFTRLIMGSVGNPSIDVQNRQLKSNSGQIQASWGADTFFDIGAQIFRSVFAGSFFIQAANDRDLTLGGLNGSTGSYGITTGNNGAGDSGGIPLIIGTASGTQGEFRLLKNGVAPTVGDVWTATNVNGEGYWATPVAASGGGGAGGLTWQELGSSPIKSDEFDTENYLFTNGEAQDLFTQIEVIPTYTATDPITMRINWYSPDTSGTGLLRAEATLIRPGTDAFNSTTNQRTTTNATVSLTVANNLNTVTLDLTDAGGLINAVGVSAGDKIKIRLFRDTDTGTSDIRFLPSIIGVSYA